MLPQLQRQLATLVLGVTGTLLCANVVLAGTIKKLDEGNGRALLRFERKIVRDLYEAEIVTVRMVSSNAVINVAVLKKRGMQALVAILPDQDLEGLVEGAEFVFVEDNRRPSHLIWAKHAGDIQLADSSLLGTEALIGYRTVQAGSNSYSSEIGYGLALRGLYRTFDYGGFGINFDTFRSKIDYTEAKQKGEFSQRRTKFYFNLTASDRVSVGGDLTLQIASRDILNANQDGTLATDYVSNQFGAGVNYRGYNYNFGLRYRNRGSLRLRTAKEGEEGRELDPFDLSSQYGLDYWYNNERSSAFFLRMSYFKFENLHGDLKPSKFESIAISTGFEKFLNAQRSLFLEVEKLAPYTPDQFGILRQTSTLNFSAGLNSIFSKYYHFLGGINLGYGTDNQDFVKGETVEERKFTETFLGLFARLEYRIR